MRRLRTAALLAALAAAGALLAAASCTRAARPQPPRNVVFILVDTLRADHLGAYGYPRPTSPNLDAFARSSLFFKDVRSQAPCTFPSVNSILTSRSPSAFLGQPNEGLGIPAQIPTLAEILRTRGFRTAAVSASAVVRKNPSRFNPHGGFGAGFDLFNEECVWKSAECVNRHAFEQLRVKDERPFFLYLHFIDPHGPYAPPDSHQRRFATGPKPDKPFIRNGNPNPIGDMLYKGLPDPGATKADLRYLIDLYDEEIRYFDGQLAVLLDELRTSGRLDDTLIVFAADHGEEFLEHGDIKHCRNLFDTEIRVPLVLHLPGAAARTLAQPVQNIDLTPTILDLLGVTADTRAFEGKSLRPLLEGKPAATGPQHALMSTLRSVSDGRFKLIHDLGAGTFALYDLRADPGETRDVLARERRTFHRLRQDLTAWLARTEGAAPADESVRKAQEELKKLRSLGYLE
jgi:arylsulfatase A-like enzyme